MCFEKVDYITVILKLLKLIVKFEQKFLGKFGIILRELMHNLRAPA